MGTHIVRLLELNNSVKKPRSKNITETQEQLTVVAYFRWADLGENDGVIWTHIRGERASAVDGLRAKKMGVNPGLPDFMFIYNGRHGWIEMKPRGYHRKKKFNPQEIRQIDMRAQLRKNGDWVAVCETLEEVQETLTHFGIPLRFESITTERIRKGMTAAIAEIGE